MQPTLLSSDELLADLRGLGKATFDFATLANEVDQDDALAALFRFTVSRRGGSGPSAKATPKPSEERLQEDALGLSARFLAANDWLKSKLMTETANRIAEESASLRKLLGKIIQLLALGSQKD